MFVFYVTGDLLPEDRFYKQPSPPSFQTDNSTFGHLTGAGKDIVLIGYLMVNDLFNVEGAETTVVLSKPLR